MRTRLLSEQLIKKRFPHLRYVRVHTNGANKATIYAWNEDLQLPEQEIRSLQHFASDYLHPYACFQVKSYHMIQPDQVPQVERLPDSILKAAMNKGLDPSMIMDSIHQLFPYGRMSFNQYDAATATIHFDFHSITWVHPSDKERISHYLRELIPLGSSCEVTYY
ncbi:hypothetical protein [Paenibacillus rigui]|uniref:Uncharacterized protein n=1 Tax=Paenibacillus rigui TaxID=554312 RepID=A0A229UTQ3_9BACL|nr:hypothetical protein [Paenibacillus rigui]OXM86279.1 hypothetical protein CF651_11110 [Paenibacillus rigui]